MVCLETRVSVVYESDIKGRSIQCLSHAIKNVNIVEMKYNECNECFVEDKTPGALKPKRIYKHKPCPHGRRHSDCKDCGGSGICPHGRRHRVCKECGGTGICQHGRQRNRCKECAGASFCDPRNCPCGRHRSNCYHCNPKFAKTAAGCSNQCGNQLSTKRKVKNGGNGLCSGCEVLLKTEAAVAGSEPPPPNKRWEDVVLDALIPRVVNEHGMKRPYESRDDHRHMLGSNKRRLSGECDTAHQRRPDLLYVVREPVDSRIVAFLSVEVDEDSHCDRDPNCEGGKIDETFQALTQLAQTEGCSLGAAARHDAKAPFGLFLKFNPNSCDVGRFTLEQRIDVLVRRCNTFLSRPASFFADAAIRGETILPHVETLFYHSNRGNSAAILALLEKSNGSHINWIGNTCSL